MIVHGRAFHPHTETRSGFCVGECRVDFLVEQELMVELKAVEQLAPVHVSQVISYLKASDRRLGLLITFNVRLLRDGIRRVVFTPSPAHPTTQL